MSTTVPVTIRVSPIPSTWQGTPQQFAEILASRLSVESTDDVSFFRTGSQLPTSDEGPFLLDGVSWYVWDVSTGAYVPLVLLPESLKYIADDAEPDHNKYTFWIVLDGTGAAIDIRYYSGGSWKSVFEAKFATYSTTTEMNAAITAALSNYTNDNVRYPARATVGSDQSIPANGSPTKLLFASETFDPNAAYDPTTSRYTAQVAGIYRVSIDLQVDNDDADASDMELTAYIGVGGPYSSGITFGTAVANPPGGRWYVGGSDLVALTEGQYLEAYLIVQTIGSGNVKNGSNSAWSVELVQRV